MAYQIREMRERDVAAAVALIASHVAEDGASAEIYYRQYFERLAAGAPRERNFVALDEIGVLAGVCGYYPDKYDTPGILWLNWFYVSRAQLGGMAGYRLFEHVLTAARRMQTRKLYLDTCNVEPYHKALRFYKSAGFAEEGQYTDYYEDGVHMLVMALDLRPAR